MWLWSSMAPGGEPEEPHLSPSTVISHQTAPQGLPASCLVFPVIPCTIAAHQKDFLTKIHLSFSPPLHKLFSGFLLLRGQSSSSTQVSCFLHNLAFVCLGWPLTTSSLVCAPDTPNWHLSFLQYAVPSALILLAFCIIFLACFYA